MPDIVFRPSQPQDVEHAVPLIYSSGPAAFDYVFSDRRPGQSVDFLRSAFVWGNSEFGYRQHTAVVLDGEVVGIGAIRYSHQNFRFTIAAVSAILRFYGPLAGIRTIRRGLRIEQIIQPPKRGVGILYHLGVAPEHRSKGIGSQLVHHFLDEIRSKEVSVAALDVAVTNPRAQALYEREGFAAVITHTSELRSMFGFVVDHVYMECPLFQGD
jgi:ribosomal protein S18 acetylase RimI-like enzyme